MYALIQCLRTMLRRHEYNAVLWYLCNICCNGFRTRIHEWRGGIGDLATVVQKVLLVLITRRQHNQQPTWRIADVLVAMHGAVWHERIGSRDRIDLLLTQLQGEVTIKEV